MMDVSLLIINDYQPPCRGPFTKLETPPTRRVELQAGFSASIAPGIKKIFGFTKTAFARCQTSLPLNSLKLLALARDGLAGSLIHGPISYRETGLAATAPEIIDCHLQVSLLHELEEI